MQIYQPGSTFEIGKAAELRPGTDVTLMATGVCVAEALKADKLVFLTDVDGILMDSRNAKTAISSLTASEARELLDSGLIQGGMVPKLRSCVRALENGVSKVAVLDGRIDHVMLLDAVSGQTMGTTLRRDEA